MDKNAVITGDLVKSRSIKNTDIEPVISSLKNTFNEINIHLLDGKGDFDVFRGDSFQGLIPKPELALRVAIIIRAHLRTYEPSGNDKIDKPILNAYSDARIAIGIGTINYKAERISESQGEAFEKSGYALDALKRENNRLIIVSPWENINNEFSVECKLADAIINRWTASTAVAMYHHLLYGKNQKELAKELKITQPGIHKRLMMYGNADGIQAFLNRYTMLITKVE